MTSSQRILSSTPQPCDPQRLALQILDQSLFVAQPLFRSSLQKRRSKPSAHQQPDADVYLFSGGLLSCAYLVATSSALTYSQLIAID